MKIDRKDKGKRAIFSQRMKQAAAEATGCCTDLVDVSALGDNGLGIKQ